MHANLIHQPSHKRLCLLRALALASLAIAGLALPFAWDILASINSMPKMHWLQKALAQTPAFSWLMMFVWGGAIPVVLLKNMDQTPSHKLRTTVVMLILMWIAVTWYVHMPASNQCTAFYGSWEWTCSALQWGYSMSLVLSIAAYAFLMLGLVVTALGLFAESLDDEPSHAA